MSWIKVAQNPRRQDQVEYSTQLDERSRVVSVTVQITQTWYAQTDDINTNTIQAAVADDGAGGAIPRPGLYYTISGTQYLCTKVRPSRTAESPLVFEVQVELFYKFAPQQSGQIWNIDISIGGQKFTQDTYLDKDGNKILNTAGQHFEPGVMKTYYDEAINISYQTINPDSAAFGALRGKVNLNPVNFTIQGMTRTFAPRQLLFDDARMSTSFVYANTAFLIWKVDLALVARQDTFQLNIPSRGYQEKAQKTDGTWFHFNCLDGNNRESNTPMDLDENGKKCPVGTLAFLQHFKIEGEADLNPILAPLLDP